MFCRVFTIILILFVLTPCLYPQWALQGKLPIPFDINSIHFVNSNTGYAAGQHGWVYRTTDSGNNWKMLIKPTNNQLNSIYFVGEQSGYVVGDEGFIAKAVDLGGENPEWIQQNSNTSLKLHSVFLINENTGWSSGNQGLIIKTTDGGENWEAKNSGTNYSLHSIYFIDRNTGWVCGGINDRQMGIILKTTNGGETWQTQFSQAENTFLNSIHFQDKENGWAAGWNGTLLKTTNGGTTWLDKNSGISSHLKSICFSDLNNGFAAGLSGTIIKTNDGGNTWQISQNNNSEDLNSITITKDGDIYTAGAKASILKSINNESEWTIEPVYYTQALNDVHFTDENTGWICAGDGLVYKTINGGDEWIIQQTNTNEDLADIHFENNNKGWAVGSDGVLLSTTNGGDIWITSIINKDDDPSLQIDLASIHFVDEMNGWIIGNLYLGVILKTSNGGVSWEYIEIEQYALRSVFFVNNTTGWITGAYASGEGNPDNGFILKSTDGGYTWEYQYFPTSFEEQYLSEIYFTDENNGYISGMFHESIISEEPVRGTFILKTTNGGTSWDRKDYKMPYTSNLDFFSFSERLLSIQFPEPDKGWAVGTGVLKTTNTGETWTFENPGLTADLRSVYFVDKDLGWAVGNEGVLLKYMTGGFTPLVWSGVFQLSERENTGETKFTYFGQDLTATNGLDANLNETRLPQKPPEGNLDLRFVLPITPPAETDRDFRNSNETSAQWEVNFQLAVNSYPAHFNWFSYDGFPEGDLYLVDGLTNGDLVNINMKTQDVLILESEPSYNSFKIVYTREKECSDIVYNEGWNLLSIPLRPESMELENLFPDRNSRAFGFSGKYFVADTLDNDKGYWIKFSSQGNARICGGEMNFPVEVKKGWNLVGSFNNETPVSQVTTVPDEIISSGFFGYENGYMQVSVLQPGKGYWVKVSNDGYLNYNTGTGKNSTNYASGNKNSGSIIIEDRSGNSVTLYDVDDKKNKMEQYELPPLPPAGVFDVRYSSGLSAENLSGESKTVLINFADYPIKIYAEGIDLKITYLVEEELVEKSISNGVSIYINESSIKSIEVTAASTNAIPKEYVLNQNYPNPFNAGTVIGYTIGTGQLSVNSKVELKIYDILGKVVAILVNEDKAPGYYEVIFDAGRYNLSSGIYFYTIKAGEFISTKKFILMK